MRAAFEVFKPDAVMHLAAESHVDRSIDNPGAFLETNVRGTFVLLEEARRYWKGLTAAEPQKARDFRFHHISTDEVFGDLSEAEGYFSEATPYAPSSPYSASKAASDHLVRAWQRTYGLPTLLTNCSNNYGPRQFPEKLIPADDSSMPWPDVNCRSTATAARCATGSLWRITCGRFCLCCRAVGWAKHMLWAGAAKNKISKWCAPSARRLKNWPP